MIHKSNRISELEAIYKAIDDNFPEHLERCQAFLRQKSLSDTGEGIRGTAEMVRSYIEAIGGSVELWGDSSFPIVFGQVEGRSPETLIVYGMYDVQPADETNWISPPFDAKIHSLPGLGDCVVARGAVNSKGALCGVFNVLNVIKEQSGIPLNLIFTIEGEEEIGSPQFESFIRENRDRLKAKGVVDFDFSQDTKRTVSMHLGLKGIVYMDLICKGGRKGGPMETSVHGSASAWISSPVWRLIKALSTLTDRRENIRISGLYDNVAQPGRTDRMLLKTLEKVFDEKLFLREMKSLRFKSTRRGVDLLKTGLYSPIININGFSAGYSGKGTKTILPRKATAKIDIRFGPRLEPEEVIEKFTRHLTDHGFDDIEVRVRDNYTWSKTDFSEPIVQNMIASYRVHGVEPEVCHIATWAAPYFVFSRILQLPVVSGGLGHGGRQHVANEYMTVEGLRDFEKFVATFLYSMADREPPGGPFHQKTDA
jgi:acetylornithine deacetylase/succinyl-diaminopimelate desuccinylase-like protein